MNREILIAVLIAVGLLVWFASTMKEKSGESKAGFFERLWSLFRGTAKDAAESADSKHLLNQLDLECEVEEQKRVTRRDGLRRARRVIAKLEKEEAADPAGEGGDE